jgi:hypothetical protein
MYCLLASCIECWWVSLCLLNHDIMSSLYCGILCHLGNWNLFLYISWASDVTLGGLDKWASFFSFLKYIWPPSDPYVDAAHFLLLCRWQGHKRTKPLHTILVFWRWFNYLPVCHLDQFPYWYLLSIVSHRISIASSWLLTVKIQAILQYLCCIFFCNCSMLHSALCMWTVLGLILWCWFVQAKLAKLRRELLTPSSKGGGGGAGEGFDVTKSGDARVGLVGFPSVGKSTLLNKLTGTFSEVCFTDVLRPQLKSNKVLSWFSCHLS